MFGSLGVPEILFILALALLVFGPKRLPEMGRTLGRALGEFRKASNDLKRSFDAELNLRDEPPRPQSALAAAAAAVPAPAVTPAAGAVPAPAVESAPAASEPDATPEASSPSRA